MFSIFQLIITNATRENATKLLNRPKSTFFEPVNKTFHKTHHKHQTYQNMIEVDLDVDYTPPPPVGKRHSILLEGQYFISKRKNSNKKTMNLGAPSLSICLKSDSAFTSLKFMLIKNTLISNQILKVIPCAYCIDGRTLKVAAEYDTAAKANIRLTVCVDETFIDENAPPNPHDLQKVFVAKAVVGCVTQPR